MPNVTTTPDGHLGTPDTNTYDNEGRLILQAPLATSPQATIGQVLTVVGIDPDLPSPTKAVFELQTPPGGGGAGPIVTTTFASIGTNPAEVGGVRLTNGILNGIYAESDPAGADVRMMYVEAGTNRVVMGDPARESFMPATRSSITYGPLHAGLVEITSDAPGYTWSEAELGHRVAVVTGLTTAKTQRWDTAAGSVERAALVVNNTANGYTLVRADGGGTGTYIPARGQQWVYSDPAANGGLGEIYGNPKILTLETLTPSADQPLVPPAVGGGFLYVSATRAVSSAGYLGALIAVTGNTTAQNVSHTISPSIQAAVGSRVVLDKIWEFAQTTGAVAQLIADYELDDDSVVNFTVTVTARRFVAGVYTTTFVKKMEAGISRSNGGIAVLIGAVAVTLNVDGTGLALDATVTVGGGNSVAFTVLSPGAAPGDVVEWDCYVQTAGRTA